jgi:hypothetical protein
MEDRETVYAAVLEIQKEWKTLGRVPIKFKNAVKADYETAIETFFEIFRQTKKASTPSTGGNFKPRTNNKEFGSNRDRQDNREKPEDALPAHISVKMTKLKKQIQVSQEIVDQYGNNIMFISKNKSGDALRAEIQAKIDVENAKIAEAKKEIKELNAEVAKLKRAQEAEKLADLPVEEVNTPVSEEETTNVVTDNKDEVTSENLEEAVIEESADTSADDAEIEA